MTTRFKLSNIFKAKKNVDKDVESSSPPTQETHQTSSSRKSLRKSLRIFLDQISPRGFFKVEQQRRSVRFKLSDINHVLDLPISTQEEIPTTQNKVEKLLQRKRKIVDTMSTVENLKLFEAVSTGDVETVKTLLQNGTVNVNYKNLKNKSSTSLHIATLNGNLEIMKHLLNAGAKVDCTDDDLRTPLHIAVCNCNEEASLLLLSHLAPLNVRDKYGYRYNYIFFKN